MINMNVFHVLHNILYVYVLLDVFFSPFLSSYRLPGNADCSNTYSWHMCLQHICVSGNLHRISYMFHVQKQRKRSKKKRSNRNNDEILWFWSCFARFDVSLIFRIFFFSPAFSIHPISRSFVSLEHRGFDARFYVHNTRFVCS